MRSVVITRAHACNFPYHQTREIDPEQYAISSERIREKCLLVRVRAWRLRAMSVVSRYVGQR